MEERKQTKISLKMAICIFIMIILFTIVTVLVYQLTGKVQEENNSNLNKNNNGIVEIVDEVKETKKLDNVVNTTVSDKQANNTNKNQSTSKETTEVDITIDKKEETILLEGMEERIKTAQYVSSLGYSMRYEYEMFTVGKDEGLDVYTIEGNSDSYCTVERYSTSYEKAISSLSSYEKMSIKGKDAVYTTKVVAGIMETNYYIKADNGVFIITTYYPNSSEAEEGIGSKMSRMIQTFSIN